MTYVIVFLEDLEGLVYITIVYKDILYCKRIVASINTYQSSILS